MLVNNQVKKSSIRNIHLATYLTLDFIMVSASVTMVTGLSPNASVAISSNFRVDDTCSNS